MAKLRVTITPEGRAFRRELVDSIQEFSPDCESDAEQLANMRQLWVLDQYTRGSSSPMTSPVMSSVFEVLVDWGYLKTEVM